MVRGPPLLNHWSYARNPGTPTSNIHPTSDPNRRRFGYRAPSRGRVPGNAARRADAGGSMKFVIAIVRPNRADEVRQALSAVGVKGMTVTEAKGYGRQKGHTEIYRGAEYQIDFAPKVKIEVAIDDPELPAVLDAITRATRTGKIGDGKIFVLDLLETVRIRTGESGTSAL
jgi:nitrogen regulatory protein P-II 2